MFVAIDNQDMDVFKVEKWININRDASGGVISPEFAMEILGKTNYFAHIKKVINNIKKACLDENGELVADEVLAYKDFILSCVNRREHEGMALIGLQELADAGDIREEFDKINSKKKVYNNKVFNGVVIRDSLRVADIKNKLSLGIPVFIDIDKSTNPSYCATFRDMDFSNVVGIMSDIHEFTLNNVTNVTDCFILETTKRLWFLSTTWKEGYDKLDFNGCTSLFIRNCENVPEQIDAPDCNVLNLKGFDLTKLDKIKVSDELEDIKIEKCENIPENLDLSFANNVTIMGCDLSDVKTLKFKDGANVCLDSDFNEVCTVLPPNIDFSNCGRVDIGSCNISKVEVVIFKNKDQAVDWADKVSYYPHIKTIYADEQGKVNSLSANVGIEM